ncbi:DUF3160 domain-containing protein [candidate division KSB1 bacterium]|nr:DUF3160 domain-containing protein [candidate division KSB1 bacterium]
MKKLFLSVCFFSALTVMAQTTEFSLTAYRQFLDENKNMPTSGLLNMYPAGVFKDTISTSLETVCYYDSMVKSFELTQDEISLLNRHGFLVTERLRKESCGWQFWDIWSRDLPVYISSDVILHAFHRSYDRILMQVEVGMLADDITELLSRMHKKLPELAARYAGNSDMERMLKDVDVYLTVPLRLLDQNTPANFADIENEISDILDLIEAEDFSVYPFFSDHCKEIDFSQFKVRGHYVRVQFRDQDYPILPKYFRAMIWLGRIEVYLLAPESDPLFCPPQTYEDIRRQTVDAVLITELMDLAGVNDLYEKIEDILKFFVGEQDNVTPVHLRTICRDIGCTGAAHLLDPVVLQSFQDSLKTKDYAFQRIQSQILYNGEMFGESVRPASAFLLFGQRYVIDSYMTGQVVYDKINYDNFLPCRLFPSTLDVLFGLGNDAAAQLLVPELDEYHYSSNIAALRYLVDSYDSDFWDSSIYNGWLSAIRELNPPLLRENFPAFMQTAAWWQHKMNGQLSSWTELRHDNLLYAKQSYTTWVVCSYPSGYVEPVPQVYDRLNRLAFIATEKFAKISFTDDELKTSVLQFFDVLYGVTDTLRSIAQKELTLTPLNEHEMSFIKSVLYHEEGYADGKVDGWYPALIYGGYWDYQLSHLTELDFLVADYHTTPSDCGGVEMGWVLHAGTGPVDLAIVTAQLPDGRTMAYAGPVMSYYEYMTEDWQRLTDQEWVDTGSWSGENGQVDEESFRILASASRPDWVNVYLADTMGRSRWPGAMLQTDVKSSRMELPAELTSFGLEQNYPNPFNPQTTIEYHLPQPGSVEINIIDILGRKVRTLVEEVKTAGKHQVIWDGYDDNGGAVASGVYFYSIQTEKYSGRRKLLLLR